MIPSDGYAMGVFTAGGYGAVTDGMVAVRAPVACQEDGWWSPDGHRIRDGVDPLMAGLDPLFEEGARWRHTASVRRSDVRHRGSRPRLAKRNSTPWRTVARRARGAPDEHRATKGMHT